MMQKQQRAVRLNKSRVIWGTLLALAVVLVMGIVIIAQTVVLPMIVTEIIEPPVAGPGDKVKITITVSNPNPPTQVARIDDSSWYNLRLTSNIDPALRIDNVDVVPTFLVLTVDGNTVVVTVAQVAPGESFTTTIDCTVLGQVSPQHPVDNEHRLDYTDAEGNPQPPIILFSLKRVMLPVVYREYTENSGTASK